MKAEAARVATVPSARAATDRRPIDFVTLTKPRLNLLVLLTTLGGLYLASPGGVPLMLVLHTLVGTALVAGGAAALNQVWERDTDGRMRRTSGRPLPRGRLSVGESTWFGVLLTAVGLADLAVATNLTAAIVAALTSLSYVLVYTPLKTRTSLATLVGAVPGALPPVIGWAAASNSVTLPAIVLFGIVFFWQMPHFLAIAILYRRDYAAGGFKMLPVVDDAELSMTSRMILLYGLALLPASIIPSVVHMAGAVYFTAAVLLGLAFMSYCVSCAVSRHRVDARKLFFASIIYLPVLLAVLMFDKVR